MELKRFLHRRPAPPAAAEREGLKTLFVHKREVRPQEIMTCTLRKMEHVPHIANRLKDSRPIIVSLEELDPPDRRRALDFISGVAYSLDSSYEEVGECVFLFIPGDVAVAES